MKKIVAILLMLAVLAALSCAGGGVAAPKKLNLTMGGSSSVSSYQMTCIAIATIWNKHVPEVNVTVVETRATPENCIGTEDGRFQMAGNWTSADTFGKVFMQVPPFKGRQVPLGWRQLFVYRGTQCLRIYATVDSGVNSISGIDGKTYSAGIPGSGTQIDLELALLNGLGIKPKISYAPMAEAIDAMKEGRLDVQGTSESALQVRAEFIEINSVRPLKILSWTKEEAEKVTKAGVLPFRFFTKVPAGAIKLFPEAGELLELAAPGGNGPATMKGNISQEIGYKMAKAMFEHWSELYGVFPGSKDIVDQYGDAIAGVIAIQTELNETLNPEFHKYYPGYSANPLHPGTVQYFKEMGYDVPEILIPPEYKG